jgi:hypothetical protein
MPQPGFQFIVSMDAKGAQLNVRRLNKRPFFQGIVIFCSYTWRSDRYEFFRCPAMLNRKSFWESFVR